MTAWESAVLGLVQGLTEFLPISSSGHLAMTRALFGLGADLPFEVLVHGATLLAILVYFRGRVAALATGRSPAYVGKLALSVLPAVVVALAIRETIERAFASPRLVPLTLAVTGAALVSLYLVPRRRWSGEGARGPETAEPSWSTAWWMGCAQAAAILPGVSRSGSTIVTGIWLGVAPSAAAEFSFLMGIPAIAGALVLEGPALWREAAAGAARYLPGAVVAFVAGLFAIRLVFRLLARREFRWFGFYCWAAAIAFAAWLALR